ncbi:hypothetical protein Sjap_001260 [Stephania japonica]|uniref:Phytosulfokine n=1 Tax=Stephania japonica TaxID=461633 RepID=A0AAP0KM57_9MAGN
MLFFFYVTPLFSYNNIAQPFQRPLSIFLDIFISSDLWGASEAKLSQRETMKQSILSYGILLLFLLSICLITSGTRPLISKQGDEEKVIDLGSLVPWENTDQEFFSSLMGVEHCENGDEECLKRRMAAEAHLDYIYAAHQIKRP